MIWLLRIFFAAVLASMLGVTTWAGLQVSLFEIPREVGGHPWFIATLFDAYWGFLTFYLWLAYKETGWISRVLWFVAVLLLGNIAMALYGLIQVWRIPSTGTIEQVLLRGAQLPAWVPVVLLALGGGLAALV